LEKLTGKKYCSALPASAQNETEQEKIDVAFRVIADHIRMCSFAIADGIEPGNKERNSVVRKVLRRAGFYGDKLGFNEPFLYGIVDIVFEILGVAFPITDESLQHIKKVIFIEEVSYYKTRDQGAVLFRDWALVNAVRNAFLKEGWELAPNIGDDLDLFSFAVAKDEKHLQFSPQDCLEGKWTPYLSGMPQIAGNDAFILHDTHGFDIEQIKLKAHEIGVSLDMEGFSEGMEEQRARARAAQKKAIIAVADAVITKLSATDFVGFDRLECDSEVKAFLLNIIVTANSPFYAEMGGQVSDTGEIELIRESDNVIIGKVGVTSVQRLSNGVYCHHYVGETGYNWQRGEEKIRKAHLVVDSPRRHAIERHHTVTHLLHWALHQVVSPEVAQKGSYVGPDKLTFDFNSAPLTPEQITEIEKLVNARIRENAPVAWGEFAYAEVKGRRDVMQFFGDKYGERVRVVQIGGTAGKDDSAGRQSAGQQNLRPHLDGYSMELCGGTHVRATGEIGLFKIVRESAIAAGVRRIEAVAGEEAVKAVCARETEARELRQALAEAGGKSPVPAVATLSAQPDISQAQALEHEVRELKHALTERRAFLEKERRAAEQKQAASLAGELAAGAVSSSTLPSGGAGGAIKLVAAAVEISPGELRGLAVEIGKRLGPSAVVLGGAAEGKVGVVALCSPEAVAAGYNAGKIVGELCAQLGGRGGGKPDFAQGGGKDAGALPEALAGWLKNAG
jgi:alanyl-tRNA synthetase